MLVLIGIHGCFCFLYSTVIKSVFCLRRYLSRPPIQPTSTVQLSSIVQLPLLRFNCFCVAEETIIYKTAAQPARQDEFPSTVSIVITLRHARYSPTAADAVDAAPSSKNKTFKPKKNIPEGTKQYQLKKYAEATLGSGNLRLAVTLPDGEDMNEWLAVNSKYYMDGLSFDERCVSN